jgi:hypothetical protein
MVHVCNLDSFQVHSGTGVSACSEVAIHFMASLSAPLSLFFRGLDVGSYTIRHEEEALWRHLSKFAHPRNSADCNIKSFHSRLLLDSGLAPLSLLIGNSLPSTPCNQAFDVGNHSDV